MQLFAPPGLDGLLDHSQMPHAFSSKPEKYWCIKVSTLNFTIPCLLQRNKEINANSDNSNDNDNDNDSNGDNESDNDILRTDLKYCLKQIKIYLPKCQLAKHFQNHLSSTCQFFHWSKLREYCICVWTFVPSGQVVPSFSEQNLSNCYHFNIPYLPMYNTHFFL